MSDIAALHARMMNDLIACQETSDGDWSWRALELRAMILRLEMIDRSLEQQRVKLMTDALVHAAVEKYCGANNP